jgi:hypothetical protein
MFTPELIQERLRRRPFQPFRIIASEGLHFDIHHPELVLVGRRELTIGTPDPQSPTIFDRIMWVELVHVVALEELPAMQPQSPNGPPA